VQRATLSTKTSVAHCLKSWIPLLEMFSVRVLISNDNAGNFYPCPEDILWRAFEMLLGFLILFFFLFLLLARALVALFVFISASTCGCGGRYVYPVFGVLSVMQSPPPPKIFALSLYFAKSYCLE
jgi:hypothetical protein